MYFRLRTIVAVEATKDGNIYGVNNVVSNGVGRGDNKRVYKCLFKLRRGILNFRVSYSADWY